MPSDPGDPRFTNGLLYDVVQALEAHGYVRHEDPRCIAHALGALLELARAFEGLPSRWSEGALIDAS